MNIKIDTQDLNYKKENSIKNTNKIKCNNYKLCESLLENNHFEIYNNYICILCQTCKWNELEFAYKEEDCAVCSENISIQLKFPKCNHWFCLKCSKYILYWNETVYHISPVLYGCNPCPNNCNNNMKGKQCYCLEWITNENLGLIDWKFKYPRRYKQWCKDEDTSIYEGYLNKSNALGSRKCPICRLDQ